MNFDHSILTLLLITPLVGALVLALVPEREGSKAHHWGALVITLLIFLFTLHLPAHFTAAMQAAHSDPCDIPGAFLFGRGVNWTPSPAINYSVGVDGLSMWLVVLTGFLAPIGVL